jgi:parallel beta-helix repeat protein
MDGLKIACFLFAACLAASLLPQQAASTTATDEGVHGWIEIMNDDNFTAENGVTGGNGTYDNPYIIENRLIDLSQNTEYQSHDGIYVARTSASFVIRNVKVHSGLVTISPSSFTGGCGIRLQDLYNGIVEDCEFTGDLTGLEISNCQNIVVRNNDILHNNRGLSAWRSHGLHVEGNNISSNTYGNIEFYQVIQSDLVNNTVILSTDWMGINLYESEDCEVHGNEIILNGGVGVNIGYCKDCKITNNTIAHNGVGITIYGSEDILALPNGFSFNHKDIENWDDDNSINPWTLLISVIAIVAAVVVAVAMMTRWRKKKPARIQPPPIVDRPT